MASAADQPRLKDPAAIAVQRSKYWVYLCIES
jgi:hypothetical protein